MWTLFEFFGGLCGFFAFINFFFLDRRIRELENSIYELKKILQQGELKREAKPVERQPSYPPERESVPIRTVPSEIPIPTKIEIIRPESPQPLAPVEPIGMKQVGTAVERPIEKPMEAAAKIDRPPVPPIEKKEAVEAITIASEPVAPTITKEEPKKEEMDLETRIGAVWFNRIGVVFLITAFALFGRYVTPRMQPWHKTALCYLAACGLVGLGRWYEERLKRFAPPVIACGLALAFFTSYAAHFLEPMRCFSLGWSLGLMTVSVVGIFYYAERRRSELTAGLAIFLGHTAALASAGSADAFALPAILFLNLAALVLILRHTWMPLGLFSVCAAYLGHLLWMRQDHPVWTPESSFWLNFVFLSSYYLIFLCADFVFHDRVWKRGKEAFSKKQRIAGRAVGPASLIFYSTFAAGLFLATPIYWPRIHFFLIPMAFLQAVVLLYHQSRKNVAHPFYTAMAVIFLTLGFFSWLGQLTLNMTLAAEALALYILARRLRWWFLNLMAQGVLALNFLHYWLSATHVLSSWPLYWGSIVISLVYFVKARLEETQPTDFTEEDLSASKMILAIRAVILSFTPLLAYIHALLGSVLVIHACITFFMIPYGDLAIAVFSLAAVVSVILLASRPLLISAWALQLSLVLLMVLRNPYQFITDLNFNFPFEYYWVVRYALIYSLLIGMWVAIRLGQFQTRPLYVVFGLGTFLISLLPLFFFIHPYDPDQWWIPLWAVGPVIYWLLPVYLGLKKFEGEVNWSPGAWGKVEKDTIKAIPIFAAGAAVSAAALTNGAVLSYFPITLPALWLLSSLTVLFLAYAVWQKNPSLVIGFLIHLLILIGYCSFWYIPQWGYPRGRLLWWITTGGLMSSWILIPVSLRIRRASFAWAGSASCLLMILFLALLFLDPRDWFDISFRNPLRSLLRALLLLNPRIEFDPYGLWIVTLCGFWIVSETLRIGYGKRAINKWRGPDAFGLDVLAKSAKNLGRFISLIGAWFVVGVTVHHFESSAMACRWLLVFSLLWACASLALRSSTVALAVLVFMTAAHGLYHFQIPAERGALEYPVLTICLLGITWLFGGALEWIFRVRNAETRTPAPLPARIIIWYFYGLALLFGNGFLAVRGHLLFGETSLIFPFRMVLPTIIFILGAVTRLGWMQLAAFGFTLIGIVPDMIWKCADQMDYRYDLFFSGLCAALEMMVMERIFAWQTPEIPARLNRRITESLRWILIAAIAFVMLYTLTYSDALRGYWTTFGWSLLGFVMMTFGFVWRDRIYRRTALVIFAFTIGRATLLDISRLEEFYRLIAFLGLGVCLIAVSFLYSRFQNQIRQWW